MFLVGRAIAGIAVGVRNIELRSNKALKLMSLVGHGWYSANLSVRGKCISRLCGICSVAFDTMRDTS